MNSEPTRREFLQAAGSTAALTTLAGASSATRQPNRPLRIAAVTTVYHYLSHAYHIVGRFLDGFEIPGQGLYKPGVEVAGLFIEQTPEATDLGRAKAKKHGVRLSPSIADALTLGTGALAVDAVLLIAEHGDYPFNDKLQKLYPRQRFFEEITKVFEASGRSVPVFNDKHLSHSRTEAGQMAAASRKLGFPLMAGSSLPITWRLPALEIPLGRPFEEVLVASRGDIEIFGFHALETLQCMAERRDRGGKPQGVVAVTCLEKDEVWKAADQGVWSRDLLRHALGRSHSLNPGDIRRNTVDFLAPEGKDRFTRLRHPIAFVVEYADGLRATALILNGHVDDTTIAVKLGGASPGVASTLMYLPAPPGARFFDPLVLRVEEFFKSGKPTYPVERTLLTGGILDAALESRIQGHKRIETPDLATIDYQAPADSGFIRTPLGSELKNPV